MPAPPNLVVNATQDAITPVLTSLQAIPTDHANRCESIDYCRTTWNIVWSCLITISLCIWVGIHPNVPQLHPPSSTWWETLVDKIKAFVDRVLIALLALVAPEFIFVWALRQLLNARTIADKCQKAAVWAKGRQHVQKQQEPITAREQPAKEDQVNATVPDQHAEKSIEEEIIGEDFWTLVGLDEYAYRARRTRRLAQGVNPEVKVDPSEPSSDISKHFTHALRKEWTTTHGFLILMGGYHQFDGDKPLVHLLPNDVLFLIADGLLDPPSEEEIQDRGKSDFFAKGIVLVQTLWFTTQCVARHIKHLPITELEIATVAYTIPIVGIYICWWDKPLGLSQPIRVQKSLMGERPNHDSRSLWASFIHSLTGTF